MTWRLFAVVVWLASWQVCHAGDLVSLVSPVESGWTSSDYKHYEMFFDGDRATYSTFQKRGRSYFHITYVDESDLFDWDRTGSEAVRPTHYRITIPAHVPKKDYPSSWRVRNSWHHVPSWDWDVVTDAVFKNGVYEGSLNGGFDKAIWHQIVFTFSKIKTLTIADVELLGPRKVLDAMWPYGKYPCDQQLVAVPPTGLDKIFSRPKPINGVSRPNPTRGTLSRLFTVPRFWKWSYPEFVYPSKAKPVIIGAVLRKPTMVSEVWRDAAWSLGTLGFRRIMVQGSFCRPHCHKYGSKGWVTLAKQDHSHKRGYRIAIKNPDKFKAYRVKYYGAHKHSKKVDVRRLLFMHCPE